MKFGIKSYSLRYPTVKITRSVIIIIIIIYFFFRRYCCRPIHYTISALVLDFDRAISARSQVRQNKVRSHSPVSIEQCKKKSYYYYYYYYYINDSICPAVSKASIKKDR